MKMIKLISNRSTVLAFFSYIVISLYAVSQAAELDHTRSQTSPQTSPQITAQQARVLKMLNQQQANQHPVKNLRLQISKLSDSQGLVYLGATINRAELLPYLTRLKNILKEDYQVFRGHQAARDHQAFHLTILSPQEYQLADKMLVKKLLVPDTQNNFSNQLNVTLLGLAKVEQDNKKTFFIVAQSSDAQLIRQDFLLQPKNFHVTLGFNPSDIYGVKKDLSTLIDHKSILNK